MRNVWPMIVALGAGAQAGCAATAVAGAASVGLMAAQERTIGQGIDDAAASAELKAKLMAMDGRAFSRIDVEVAQGRALLTGSAPSLEHRIEAERAAWTVAAIERVDNDIEIGPTIGLWRAAQDQAIALAVRSQFVAADRVRAIDFNIEVHRGAVYLMGVARDETEIAEAAEIAARTRGVERVVSLVELRRGAAAAAAAEAIEPPRSQPRDDLAAGQPLAMR